MIHDDKIKEKAAKREERVRRKKQQEAELVTVDEALSEEKVIAAESDRQNVRVLVLTRDPAMLVHASAAQQRLAEYGHMFAEVHVIVFCMRGESANEPVRIAKNVWVYPTNSSSWWKMPFDGYRLANDQLLFGQSFRVDLIIAEDPFESGAVAWYLGRKHDRQYQVHILENYFDADFKNKEPHNGLRLTVSSYVMPRVACVRTETEFLKEKVVAEYPELADVTEVLPMYYNLDAWEESDVVADLSEIYPQFKFALLHFSSMTERSHTEEVIDGLYYLLRQYSTLGLVIVGDGPEREALEDRVVKYELGEHVKFLDNDDEFVSYIKTAHALVHTSKDSEDDKFILCAARVGTPMIAADHGLAETLFEDGVSAFLCPVDSPPCIGEKVNRFLSENPLRNQFKRYAREAVKDRVEQDYAGYIESYRNSIIRCLVGADQG